MKTQGTEIAGPTALVRIRVDGAPEAVTATVNQLTSAVSIARQSPPRPSRKVPGHVLVYLDVIQTREGEQ